MGAIISHASRRKLVWLALAVAAAIGISVWKFQSGAAAPASPLPVVSAIRGDVVVTVGGVGRIVQARGVAQVVVPTAVGGGAATSGSAAGGSAAAGGAAPSTGNSGSAPADAVFAHASGHLSKLLVTPGQRVSAGQVVALIDDAGSSLAAVKQAQNDLATARVELRQKRTSDPLKGFPASAVELAAGRLAVVSARARLAQLLGPARPADVAAARLDVKRAEADLETLRGGTPAARARAISVARHNVEVAQDRLNKVLAGPDPADVAQAEADVKKAEADLAVLQRAPQPPLPEAVTAAQQAVTVARQNLATAQAGKNSAEIAAAQLELDKALADLAALLKPPPGPTPEEIVSAQRAVDAARAKLAKLLRPADPGDVRAARLDVERAEGELKTLLAGPSKAALASARQAVLAARARLKQLLGPPLRPDVTAARLDVRKAEADLAVLRARGGPASTFDVELAQLKIAAARAKLAVARFDSRLLTVRTPTGGTVTELLSVPGAPVDATTPILTVDNLSQLAVSVDLSEFDAARVKAGLKAIVKVDALGGKSFPGKVLFAALTGTDNAGVVTFPTRVGLTRSAGLKPGMNVSVRIIVAERRNVVAVPLEAVSRDDEDRPFVTVEPGSGRTSIRRVKLGLANNKNVEIVKGLRAGERVVLAESQGGGEE